MDSFDIIDCGLHHSNKVRAGFAEAIIRLGQLYDQVMENLQDSKPEKKALALHTLDIKVYAGGTDDVEIQGIIALELPTTGQISRCSCSGN